MTDSRRGTPRTDDVLADPRLVEAVRRLGRPLVKRTVTATLDLCREGRVAAAEVADVSVAALPPLASSLRPVLNATGVLVHTNLGRAPLSEAAVAGVVAAAGTTDVELDLGTGRRAARGGAALRALAGAVPDAEAVHVVNNGAAALALVAGALGRGGNVVIARGELVEIGDGFRIPALVESAGVTLREVGTTNRVRLDDYAEAVDGDTAFVLKVHPSNFVVGGFTSAVPVAELAGLPVPVVADIGSGLLRPHPLLPQEPDASTALRSGAALVTASGDKLLGGPQCGLVLGRAGLVRRVRRHPLARAVRVDKLTLAALEATLTGPVAPVPAALRRTREELLRRAQRIAEEVAGVVPAGAEPSSAAVGGGGAPGVVLRSAAVVLPAWLAAPLRAGDPPVVGHVEQGRLLLDLVAVDPAYDAVLTDAVRRAAAGGPRG